VQVRGRKRWLVYRPRAAQPILLSLLLFSGKMTVLPLAVLPQVQNDGVAPDGVAAGGATALATHYLLGRLLFREDSKEELAQKLDRLQPFIAVFPQDCVGQFASFGPTWCLPRDKAASPPPPPPGAAPSPWVRSRCHFRSRATEYVSESG
jgi:hypothetical protein